LTVCFLSPFFKAAWKAKSGYQIGKPPKLLCCAAVPHRHELDFEITPTVVECQATLYYGQLGMFRSRNFIKKKRAGLLGKYEVMQATKE
jgi:hypothetical protein